MTATLKKYFMDTGMECGSSRLILQIPHAGKPAGFAQVNAFTSVQIPSLDGCWTAQ